MYYDLYTFISECIDKRWTFNKLADFMFNVNIKLMSLQHNPLLTKWSCGYRMLLFVVHYVVSRYQGHANKNECVLSVCH